MVFSGFIKEFALLLIVVVINQITLLMLQSQFNIDIFKEIFINASDFYLVNGFLIASAYLLVYAITNKRFFSCIFTFILVNIIGIINYFKIKYIASPLMLGDFYNLTHIDIIYSYLNNQDKFILISVTIVFLLFLIAAWLLDVKIKRIVDWKYGRIIVLLFLVIMIYIFSFSDKSSKISHFIISTFGLSTYTIDLSDFYNNNGLISGILFSEEFKGFKPMNYSDDTIHEIVERYDYEQFKKTNEVVIYVQSESFYDPNKMSEITVNKDAIPNIRYLMDNYTSGQIQLSKNVMGTSYTEYQALTGLDLNYFRNYDSPYNSYLLNKKNHPTVGDLFDNSIIVHTYNAELYNRKRIYGDIYSFDKFKYDGSEYDLKYKEKIDNHDFISDESGFKEVLEEIKEIPNDESGFIFYLTMQNHNPYEENYYNNLDFNIKDHSKKLTDEEIKELKIYIQGLKYTDNAISNFINQLNDLNRKVTVVFFGDHKPRISAPVFSDEEGRKTDYFIYQNYQKKKLEYPLISTNYLSTVMLQLSTIRKSPFYKMLENQFKVSPVIYENKYLDVKSKELYPISNNEKLKEILYRYDVIHSEIYNGMKYLDDSFFAN